MATTSASTASFDSCITCTSKHNRVRPSLCQCKHCSNSFCFDCMKDHNEELQQNTAYASNRYNDLKLLITNQRKLMTDETIKSKEQMSEWLRKYIENLTAEKARFDAYIERTEKEAQKFVRDIEIQLQTVGPDVEAFTKTSTYQSEHMEKLLKKLDDLIQQISALSVTREYDLPSTMPKYKFEFNYSSKSTTNEIPQASKTTEEQNQCNLFDCDAQSSLSESSNVFVPDENYFCNRDKCEYTSYVVNCMASDGINIMYSTIEDPQHDMIAYCYLDINNCNYRQDDPYRPWLTSRIVDMIWWNRIQKFVCATANGIRTVEYLNKRFKILTVTHDQWTDVRVAAGGKFLWIHEKGTIMVYNVDFILVRSMNFEIPSIIKRESFCVTDKLVAFLIIRGDQTRSDILQIQFYDYNMIKIKSFDMGLGQVPCMVRTDGTNRFFIAGGKQVFRIMSSKGPRGTIDLGKEASCIAVVNSRSIVLTKLRLDLELVRC